MYGLDSNVASTAVNSGALLPILLKQGEQVGQDGPTAEQVLFSFAHADPKTIAQMQMYLYKGGFYGSTPWTDLNLGVIRPDDLDAFKNAVTVAAQTGADLSEYVRRQAAWGVYTGATANGAAGSGGRSGSGSAASRTVTIDRPDPKALGKTIDVEFQKLLGHKPNAHERAGFIAAYTSAYQKVQIENYQRQYGISAGEQLPGPVSGSSAAPQMLPTEPAKAFSLMDLFGDLPSKIGPGVNPVSPNDWSSYLRNLPDDVAAKGVVPARLSAHNAMVNQRNIAADNSFLALADQPLPGMAGYSAGSSGGRGSLSTVVQQQNFDPQAFADEWVQQHHTAEAGAHSVADVFSSFLNILHGGMQ